MTYQEALAAGKKVGARRAPDAALMALVLDGAAQLLLGAVSARLVWEGAQAKGLTTQQLMLLIHDDPIAASELMWVERKDLPCAALEHARPPVYRDSRGVLSARGGPFRPWEEES
jgi:hypothetical protein